MELEKRLKIAIVLLVIIIMALYINYNIYPEYKLDIQHKAIISLVTTQATQQILYYPIVQTQDNQAVLQYITWQKKTNQRKYLKKNLSVLIVRDTL